jgi:hypothetical protein
MFNRGFDLMIPKPKEPPEDFNYKISFKVFSKQITLSFKVNSKE